MIYSKHGQTIGKKLVATVNRLLLLGIGIYRTVGTTHLGGSCRFEPSCSEFAADALKLNKPLLSLKVILKRLSKCHPFSHHCGYDPLNFYLKVKNAN